MKKRVRLDEPVVPRKRVRLDEDDLILPEPAPPPHRQRVRLDDGPIEVMTEYKAGDHRTMYPAFPGDKPTECTLCGHIYWRPCNGERPDCANGIFHMSQQGKRKDKRR